MQEYFKIFSCAKKYMAIYRQVHVSFWQDGFVIDLTPEKKYFYLYLMTNGKTTQCGVYELPHRVIEMDTGYNREKVEKLLNRFEEYGKIKYCKETKEILLVKWMKFHYINSATVKNCIISEAKEIKSIELKNMFYEITKNLGLSDIVSKIQSSAVQSADIQHNGEKERDMGRV